MAITFYQDNKRNPFQPFSTDNFKLRLSEILAGCVIDFDRFLIDFLSKKFTAFSGVTPCYAENDLDIIPINEREIIDYLIDIPTALFLLYILYLEERYSFYQNQIDLRIQEINDAIGPRTGERVIKSY
jgi:hypothetical protein